MKSIVRRDMQERHTNNLKQLAEGEGRERPMKRRRDAADRRRRKKASNEDCINPMNRKPRSRA